MYTVKAKSCVSLFNSV